MQLYLNIEKVSIIICEFLYLNNNNYPSFKKISLLHLMVSGAKLIL